jgi:hypothetical protein
MCEVKIYKNGDKIFGNTGGVLLKGEIVTQTLNEDSDELEEEMEGINYL